LKVLHVFKDYFPPTYGGIEQHVHDLVHSLDGFRFCVMTSSRSRRGRSDDDGGVRVIRSPEYARPFSTPITPEWLRLARGLRPDLIHAHLPSPFGELALLTSRPPVPVVASYHADIGRGAGGTRLYRPLQQAFLRRAARVVVSSPVLAETSPALARHRDRMVVIPYGVDAADWRPRPPAADAVRRRHPGPLVVFLGRLVRYKRVDLLIDAIRTLDATLLVVGDGPESERLERLARRSDSASKTVFVGAVDNDQRAAYYHAADVFVLPSATRAEGFSIAMLEAMACGTPAVCTELGTGTSWLNVHGQTGLVVRPGDAGELAAAVRAVLEDDVARRAMAAAAAERARLEFTKERMLGSIAALYRELGTG
jgi:rhamnosyl/mannosyltransferase